ncbi:MAG: hypothetical protein V1678_02470 [Candidatus Aenigmatarchaeota archaeon]
MKGQFFIMTTVIMIYTLMALIQYLYDFSDIDLVQLKKGTELYSIQNIKDVLNSTVISSSFDCNKAESDVNSTEEFLRRQMIYQGINLTIMHRVVSCSPVNFYFNFSLRTPEMYTFTEFTTYAVSSFCPDGTCSGGENCPADRLGCLEPAVCYLQACNNGCTPTLVAAGAFDNEGIILCSGFTGCGGASCECDGFGNCIDSSFPPPP